MKCTLLVTCFIAAFSMVFGAPVEQRDSLAKAPICGKGPAVDPDAAQRAINMIPSGRLQPIPPKSCYIGGQVSGATVRLCNKSPHRTITYNTDKLATEAEKMLIRCTNSYPNNARSNENVEAFVELIID